jgi:hypothetical protein
MMAKLPGKPPEPPNPDDPPGPSNQVWRPRPTLPRLESAAGKALERAVAKGIASGTSKVTYPAEPANPADRDPGLMPQLVTTAKRPGKKLQFDRNKAKQLHEDHPKWNAKRVAAKITDADGNHPQTAWVYQHWK